ncbi:hypothetical protein GCM10009845_27200 [Pedococcus bigeumensis]
MQRLETVWAAVEDDCRQVVFVGGEPGVGKTRLVVEAAAALREQGAAVLWGSCREEFNTPYRPFVAILEQALEQAPAQALRDITTHAAAPLLRLTKATLGHWPTASVERGDGDSQPVLFDAVLRVLLAVVEQGPAVLVLEDLHWAPEPTLGMLSHLVESTAGEQLLILATRRTTAPDRTDPVSFALADLHRLDGVARIDLVGLTTEDVAQYLVREARVSPRSARAAAPVVRDHTGGNPFFLQEYWYDLASRGGLDALRLGSAKAPRSVQDALARRLAAFDLAHTRVLELAAVAGDMVDPSLLVSACDLGADMVLEGIDLAVRAGLLVADAEAGGYRFVHSLVRQAVLDQMAATDLAGTHGRIAAVLETRVAGDDPSNMAQLAHHYVEARALGHGEKAVRYLVMAAQQAVRGIAHGEAATLYEQAAQLHVVDGPPQGELLFAAARCHMHAGHFPVARQIYDQLSTDRDPKVRLLAAIGHEDASWRPSENGQRSLEMLSKARQASSLDDDDPLNIHALASMGRAASFTGDRRQARELGEEALRLARLSADEHLTAHALGATLWQGLNPALAPALLARALEMHEIATRLGSDDHLGPAAFHRGAFAYIVGDEPEWSSAQRDMTEIALSRGQPFFRYVSGCSRFAHRYAVGDFAGAAHIAAWLDDQFSHEFDGATEGSWGLQQFMLHRVTGGLEQIRPLITGEESLEHQWLPGLLALYTGLGMVEPAGRLLRYLSDRLDDYRAGAQWAGVLAFATEAAAKLDDVTAAACLRPLLTEYAGSNLMAGANAAVFGSADRYLGQLDSLLGDPSADRYFERALEMDRRMGAATHQVETLTAWSWHRARAGGPTRGQVCPTAASLAEEARAMARRIGHRRVLTELDAEPAPRVQREPLPNGLTEREVDVLRLVAEGLSNREIGERLFISANTSANHVRSILLKTASLNRTKAAIFAVEHGLL